MLASPEVTALLTTAASVTEIDATVAPRLTAPLKTASQLTDIDATLTVKVTVSDEMSQKVTRSLEVGVNAHGIGPES